MLNRRRTPRILTEIEAHLTLLDDPVATVSGHLTNISEGGLQVIIDRSSRIDAAVRLDVDDVTMYGQIRYCCPGLGAYVVGVSVELILLGGNELTCSVADLLEYWATANTDLPEHRSA